MNLALLLIAARPWTVGPVEAFMRTTAAIALLSIEMQLVTLAGIGSLSSLVWLNAAIAVAAWLALRHPTQPRPSAAAGPLPWIAIGVMAALALLLATRPLEGADPYHLDRVAQILRLGTLEYELSADIKVNVLAS